MATETKLAGLLLRYEELGRDGQAPSAEELCHDCPELLGELKLRIEALKGGNFAAVSSERETRTTPRALAGTLKPGELVNPPPDTTATTPDSTASDAGDLAIRSGSEPVPGYRLVGRLGRGNFGEVWKAIAPGGFPVALKLMPLGDTIRATELNALEIIKSVRHPNLISSFGAWQIHGLLIVAMELADRTLWDRFQEARDQGLSGIPAAELLEYLRQAAKGIDYLNEPQHSFAGKPRVSIQHRDIKPKNILLVGSGVKVADFGLVRLLDRAITGHTGNMTPAYAAPEFLRGQTSNQSDQYCLAATYCELRGGRLPFEGTLAQVLNGHLANSPDLSMLPESERAVVKRALAKDPGERWPGCRAFVEALAETMHSGSVPRRQANSKWLAVAAAAVLVGFMVFFLPPLLRTPADPKRPVHKRSPDVIAGTKSTDREASHELARESVEDETRAAIASLKETTGPEQPGHAKADASPPDNAAAAEAKLVADSKSPAQASRQLAKAEVPKSAAADTALVNTKSAENVTPTIEVTKKPEQDRVGELCRFRDHQGAVLAVAVSPVGDRAISSDTQGNVWLWDVWTGKPVERLVGHGGAVHCVAFSRDGRLAVFGGEDKSVRLWNIETQSPFGTLNGHVEAVYGVAFSSDGSKVVSGGQDTSVRVWSVADRNEVNRFELPPGESVWSLAMLPGDHQVLTASDSTIVRLWEIGRDHELHRFEDHKDVVWCIDCSADGSRALSGGGLSDGQRDFALRLWDVEKRKLVRRLEAHTGAVRSVALSLDGRRAVSGSTDTTVRLWDVESGDELHCFRGHEATIHSVAIARDGRLAVSASADGTVRVWRLPP